MKRVVLILTGILMGVLPMMAGKSVEAQAVLNIFNSLYGNKVITCSMANVNWNIIEAENVYRWTGKYPAMNTFDFIHAPYSKDILGNSWIDYSDIAVVKDWWQQGGLVGCMWHWLVPNKAGDGLTYSTSETNFDPGKINDPTSADYARMVSDMDQIARYLLLMKEQHIPVVWRPMHEAAGNTNIYAGGTAWFWWGSKGAEVYKTLWRFMYDYFTITKGLDNLIWVWNGGEKDDDWYPGDEYVDIVGTDYYGSSLTALHASYTHLDTHFPSKPVALTECGHSNGAKLPSLQSIWESGGKWLWAMPWYDYSYNAASNPVNSSHSYYEWYVAAMSFEHAVDRAAMKILLQETAAIDDVLCQDASGVTECSVVYDLHGCQVPCRKLQSGIYIRNGRVVIMR